MKRQFGSAISAVALLAIATGAAAVNVKILHANPSDTSVLNVREAADVTTITSPATPAATTDPADPADPAVAAAADPLPSPSSANAPAGKPTPPRPGHARPAIGSVGGQGDDDMDDEGEDAEDGEHEFGGPRARDGFMQLRPEQMALLRVARLAQMTPAQARDAANGIGTQRAIDRVKAAAAMVGIPLADLAAITDLPPRHGLGHGGEDAEHEGDDDD